MLGSGMFFLGIPVAIGSCLQAYRDDRDRGFVWTALVVCALMVVLSIAELAIRGGVIRRFLP